MGRVDVRAAADATPATLTISEIELLRADCERLLYEVARLRTVVEAVRVARFDPHSGLVGCSIGGSLAAVKIAFDAYEATR